MKYFIFYIRIIILFSVLFILSACEKEGPKASFTIPLDSEGNESFVVNEELEFINTSTNADSYEWYFGDGGKSTEENPTYAYNSPGSYYVSLIASNKHGKGQAIGAVMIYNTILYLNLLDDRNDNTLDSVLVIVYDDRDDYLESNISNAVAWGYSDEDGEIAFVNLSKSTPYYFYARKDLEDVTYFSNYNYNDYLSGFSDSRTVLDIRLKYYEPIPFPSTFYNLTHTDIDITIQGVTQTAPVGGSTTFIFTSNPGSYYYEAETSGKTTGGTQIGLKITWKNTHYVSDYTSYSTNLSVGSDYFFLYLQNRGYSDLGPLRVNAQRLDMTTDYITIPNDWEQYEIGYYRAFYNTRIEADYHESTYSYVYWESLPFTWTNNQYLELYNSLKKAEKVVSASRSESTYSGTMNTDVLVTSEPATIATDKKADRTDYALSPLNTTKD